MSLLGSRLAAIQETQFANESTLRADDIPSSDLPPSYTDVLPTDTMYVAAVDQAMTNPTLFDDISPALEASQLAGYTIVTAARSNGAPIVISVDETGLVTALSSGNKLEVAVGEDQLIVVEGEKTGLGLVKLGGSYALTNLSETITGFEFSWPSMAGFFDDVVE